MPKQYLTEGWQARAYEQFQGRISRSAAAVLHQSSWLGAGRGAAGVPARRVSRMDAGSYRQRAGAHPRRRNRRRTRSRARRSAGPQGRSRAAQQGHGQALARRARGPRQVHQRREAGARRARTKRRKADFERAALAKRLDAEWLDLTVPAPGVRARQPASDHADPVGDRRPVPLARFHACSTGRRSKPNSTTSTR